MSAFLKTFEFLTGVLAIVYDGQHTLKFQLGRAKHVLGPGVHFKIPIIESFKTRDTRDTTLDLEPQIIQLRDDLVYEIDAKLIYQIIDLRKALIEVDDLVTGLKNRVTMAIQRVVKARDRASIRDMPGMIQEVRDELGAVENEWGIKVHEFGFSNFAPTPATLEITQLQGLADEKLRLYERFVGRGLSEEAAVSLVSGAVVTLRPHGDLDHQSRPSADGARQGGLEADAFADPDEDDLVEQAPDEL